MAQINIHQYHEGTRVGDGITNAMLFAQKMFRGMGFGSKVYADGIEGAIGDRVEHFENLRPHKNDILLIHHGWNQEHLPRLAALPCRKFLVFHSITPPSFFEEASVDRKYSLTAFAQLTELHKIVEGSIAVSEHNARQLRRRGFENVCVIPLLKDFGSLREAPHRKFPYYDTTPAFRALFVGRITPHKRQDELVRLVGEIRSIRDVPLELVIVGRTEDSIYEKKIERLIHQFGLARHVSLTGLVPEDQLLGYYRSANVYISLSEHEGFGIPLIEAMALDLPVVAYSAAGIPETLDDSGILIHDKRPSTVRAHLLRLAEDFAFRSGVIRKQRDRVRCFSHDHILERLCEWLECNGVVNAKTAKREPQSAGPGGRSGTGAAGCGSAAKKHYVIEGPYESSYSLAYVNREIARALTELPACNAHILPGEGTESYKVDRAAEENLPAAIRRLVTPLPLTSDPIVTIRNTYPPRPNGLLGDVRLLHFAWEESIISAALAEMMNVHLDGVVVPSEFVRHVLRDSGVRRPVAVIGHGIDNLLGDLAPKRSHREHRIENAASPFTFLHVSSGLARKGVEELILAYTLAFTSADPVMLLIKTSENDQNVVFSWLDRVCGGLLTPPIQVITEDLTAAQMRDLYRFADAMVLPTRGEAFNLPAAEALAAGLPLIVTGYTGHLDYCNAENAKLIDFEFDISTSHVRVPNSLWVRASVAALISGMKEVLRDRGTQGTPTTLRVEKAIADVRGMRWHPVAQKVDDFVQHLMKRRVMPRKLRLAWVSTYNSRCGLATYSESLLKWFGRDLIDLTVIANNEAPIKPDPAEVIRLWTNRNGTLDRVARHMLEQQVDAVMFQFNYGLFALQDLAATLDMLQQHNIDTYVTFHKTAEADIDGQIASISEIGPVLARCSRLFVHAVDDVQRLKGMGLIKNVILLPHGVAEVPSFDRSTMRTLLGLGRRRPIIGSFGFLVPPKGVPQLIHAFAAIRARCPEALLLLICAEYNIPESRQEYTECLALCRALGLEDNVLLVNDFVEEEAEAMVLLSVCDIIVFGYQFSSESASGAVRVALATGRPVGTTPIPIFSELSELVYQFSGTDSGSIADGMITMLAPEFENAALRRKQQEWIFENSWATQSKRMQNIMLGCFDDRHGVQIGPLAAPSETQHVSTASNLGGSKRIAGS